MNSVDAKTDYNLIMNTITNDMETTVNKMNEKIKGLNEIVLSSRSDTVVGILLYDLYNALSDYLVGVRKNIQFWREQLIKIRNYKQNDFNKIEELENRLNKVLILINEANINVNK